jgi:hypothetical protein
MENEFPPNSHSEREARPARSSNKSIPEQRVVKRVTANKVTFRKKPLRRKFIEAFRPEDNVGFVEYILLDKLVPGLKDAVADASTSAIENLLGVGGTSRSRHRSRGGGYTSYNRMSSSRSRGRRDRDDDPRTSRREARVADDAREIILDTKVEAEEVLDALIELISKYEYATMRDLMSMLGENINPTHEDWGWSDLRGARIHRIGRDGYLLDLPRPEYLD